MSDSLRPPGLQHTRLPCPSPTPRVYSSSCPLSRCGHPAILCSVIPFSSCLQSFPATGSFPVSQFFASGGQNIGPIPPSIRVFSNESVLHIRWPKYWSFSSASVLSIPLGWPWEAQSSPRVARESWGLRSSHCRAEETSPRRVSG